MIDPMVEAYARLLSDYCVGVQPGEHVAISTSTLALPMARALNREVLRRDANPVLHLDYPEKMEDLLELATDRYLQAEPTLELSEIKQIQAWIRVAAPHNTRALQKVDKARVASLNRRNHPVQQIRVQQTRWCGTLYPTEAGAQDADMSLSEFERFVYNAMFLFDADPAARWREVGAFQASLIERLRQADEVRIQADGTDLTLRVTGRTWINSDGKRNMPSGEVFTAPLENSANGTITYDVPSSVNGVEVETIRVTFKDGKAVKAKADKGDDLLQAQLETDEGARFLGELGIGTNGNIQQPTRSILYDEKMGGTVHLALGQAYAESGGTNQSALHWDMICDLRKGGAIYLDGELFQENGQFKL